MRGTPEEKILKLYGMVFDENGEIRVCGREKCKSLIYACRNLDPNTYFGDTTYGFMEVDAIKDLWEKLNTK